APHGVEATDDELLGHFAKVEHRIQAGSFLSYREVLTQTLFGVSEALGFEATASEASAFANSVGDWPAFADTVAALRRLSTRYKLAVVSNVDDDLFKGSAKRLEVPFDWVVTAEQVGSYKPAPAHFHEVLKRTGVLKAQILHVAQSLFHDVAPASALGFTTLWINRRAGHADGGATPPSDAKPNAEVPDMKSAAELLLDH
ncbi:MAG: HAD-IA family hydrolase, partial [Longimicrobiales bacterium]